MTQDQQFHQLLIDAICGVGFPSVLLAQECERVGMADYDSVTTRWLWDRKALSKLPVETLQELYQGLCDEREANFTPTDPVDDYQPSLIITQ